MQISTIFLRKLDYLDRSRKKCSNVVHGDDVVVAVHQDVAVGASAPTAVAVDPVLDEAFNVILVGVDHAHPVAVARHVHADAGVQDEDDVYHALACLSSFFFFFTYFH